MRPSLRIAARIAAFLLLFLPVFAAAQTTVIDTIYTPPGYQGGALRGTIFIPATSKGAAVVLLHGGGGNRTDLYTWCDSLAANGFVAMTVSYPDLSVPNSAYPIPVRAFKTGVEFLRANAARFGITTNKIMGLGISYGAMTLGQAISSDNRDDILGTDPAIDDAVQGAVMLYGAYNLRRMLGRNYNAFVADFYGGDTALARAGDPMSNLERINSPVLMGHGSIDDVYPADQSQEFHNALVQLGKQSRLAIFNNQNHMFDFNLNTGGFSPAGVRMKELVVDFFNSLLSGASAELPESVAGGSLLCRAVPNPAVSQVTVSFCLRQRGNVILSLIDPLGREVRRHDAGVMDAGCGEQALRLDGVPAGAYYCRVQTGGQSGLVQVIVRGN